MTQKDSFLIEGLKMKALYLRRSEPIPLSWGEYCLVQTHHSVIFLMPVPG